MKQNGLDAFSQHIKLSRDEERLKKMSRPFMLGSVNP